MFETIRRIAILLRREDAQALAEYALVLGLVALAAVIALGLLGTAIGGFFTDFVAEGFGGAGS